MNKNPEQYARDLIDKLLIAAGWSIQDKNKINFEVAKGIAVREYQTSIGFADYVLFVESKPIGVIEAKKAEEGLHLLAVAEQSQAYANAQLKWIKSKEALPFVYESTGLLTHFTNAHEPKPRARVVFSFHTPETLWKLYQAKNNTLRSRLLELPQLPTARMRDCQIKAITNLEQSFKENRPRALIQMATGSGKTFTAITAIYRLLKYAKAKRVLFLVDTRNLGEQAEQEFRSYTPNDDNRQFCELYNVQRLQSFFIADSSHVCISTIQRLYSILKENSLADDAEDLNPNELYVQHKEPLPVVYNEKLPIDFFDFIVIDECHRSIYNLWKQVLDYFDAFLIGLTATPDKRTFGFFNQNVVSEYTHEQAVADGVNVGYNVFLIQTKIAQEGATIEAKEWIDKRHKLTRQLRWEQTDEEISYSGKELDRSVVNPSTIRLIIKTFKENLPTLFPQRKETPKTLIFAKDDSHADDIIKMVREEFGESNDFCKKITYKAEDPKQVLSSFRNDYNPRIAVTVDMIATGTDVRPLECLIFMRDVKSRNYFEQMKGRGTRTYDYDNLIKISPSVQTAKTHFVLVDAVGITQSVKTDSRPLERKPSESTINLLKSVMMGAGQDEDTMTSLAGRLSRLAQTLTSKEKMEFQTKANGATIHQLSHKLLEAWDEDVLAIDVEQLCQAHPDLSLESAKEQAQETRCRAVAKHITGELIQFVETVRKNDDQIIDILNQDEIKYIGYDTDYESIAQDFRDFIQAHQADIEALSLYYAQPFAYRQWTQKMLEEVLSKLKQEYPQLLPQRVWEAFAYQDKTQIACPSEQWKLMLLLLRRVLDIDKSLMDWQEVVHRNFQKWTFDQQAGATKFSAEQMQWLHHIRDFFVSNLQIQADDLTRTPFDAEGGKLRFYALFGKKDVALALLEELNDNLVA